METTMETVTREADVHVCNTAWLRDTDGFNSGAPRTVQQANQGTQERLISALWFGHLLPLDRPTRCCWMEATDGFNRRWRGS